MTLGYYQNFPVNLHWTESFVSSVSAKSLQERFVRLFFEINQKEFSFEDVSIPTLPSVKIVFEFGLAEDTSFNFLDQNELKKALTFLANERLQKIDFFCAIRYQKVKTEKRSPLKFDYYLIRAIFTNEILEIQLFHERGPRHISPEELTAFICIQINEGSTKKILRPI